MRKLLFVILFLAFLLLSQKNVLADEYSDYVRKMDIYRQTRSSYELARLNYLSSKTLASKSAAESATLAMLSARDEVVVTHLLALKKASSDFNIYSQIDSEVDWHKTHEAGLPSAGSLENLVAESQKAKDRYKSVTELLMYNALGTRELGKIADLRSRIDRVIGDTNSKLGEIRQNGDKNTQKAERWLLETDARLKRSDEKKTSAKDSLDKLADSYRDKADTFRDFQSLIIESNQFMKEAASYLKEIVKEIRTKD